MTKSFLCVKIIIMKNITLMKKLKLSILLFLTATLLTCFAVISFTTVKADENAQPVAEMFTPLSALETGSNYIVSPSDVYSDDSVTAIVCDNTTKLVVYQNGTFSEIQGTFTKVMRSCPFGISLSLLVSGLGVRMKCLKAGASGSTEMPAA